VFLLWGVGLRLFLGLLVFVIHNVEDTYKNNELDCEEIV